MVSNSATTSDSSSSGRVNALLAGITTFFQNLNALLTAMGAFVTALVGIYVGWQAVFAKDPPPQPSIVTAASVPLTDARVVDNTEAIPPMTTLIDSAWVKVGYFLPIEDRPTSKLKIVPLNISSNSVAVSIRQIADEKVIAEFTAMAGEAGFAFDYENAAYTVELQKTGQAGVNIFARAAFFKVAKTSGAKSVSG
jgi:hypothetical protein